MKILKLWLPVFIWCGLIFYLSNTPNLDTGLGFLDFILRKLAHIIEYFILVFLLYRAFKGSFRLSSFYLAFWPSLLTFLYAASDEAHQAFVPTRGPSITDVLVDSLGIVVFIFILRTSKGVLWLKLK